MKKKDLEVLGQRRAARFHVKTELKSAHHKDARSRFQRDRDRVLYSAHFRRLAGITQVVHAGEGHVFHNRMTHSLKVAQVARRLAEYLKKHYGDDELAEAGGLNEDVAETAGLCHDIGHPPFGHAAEYELQDLLAGKDGCEIIEGGKKIIEADGFEGNAQSFRIVTKTSRRDHYVPGLDLTAASLSSVLKYPWSRSGDKNNKRHSKFGFYQDEKAEFDHARSFLSTGDERQSLEAAIMDWADDVSYAVHDIDDAFRNRLVPLERLYGDDSEKERFVEWHAARHIRHAVEKVEKTAEKEAARTKATKEAEDVKKQTAATLSAVSDLTYAPRESFANTNEDIGRLQRYSSMLLTRYLQVGDNGITINSKDKNDKRLLIPDVLRSQVDLLKSVMVYYVYESPALVAQQVGQRKVIGELFRQLFAATQPDSRKRGLIPPPFQAELAEVHKEDGPALQRGRVRLAIDIITSLTEQQAVDYYKRLTGHSPGSVRDRILY